MKKKRLITLYLKSNFVSPCEIVKHNMYNIFRKGFLIKYPRTLVVKLLCFLLVFA